MSDRLSSMIAGGSPTMLCHPSTKALSGISSNALAGVQPDCEGADLIIAGVRGV